MRVSEVECLLKDAMAIKLLDPVRELGWVTRNNIGIKQKIEICLIR